MKKKFVLTLALVLMVAASLVAATPLEVSGDFYAGYVLKFDPNSITDDGKGLEGEIYNVTFKGDFFEVKFSDLKFTDAQDTAAKATVFIDKALAEQGFDMGDVSLKFAIGNMSTLNPTDVYSDSNDAVAELLMLGKYPTMITLGYSDMVTVELAVDPSDTANKPVMLGAKFAPIEGVSGAVGYTNYAKIGDDITGVTDLGDKISSKGGMTGSVVVDVAKLADLSFGLNVSAIDVFYFEYDTVTGTGTAVATNKAINNLYAEVKATLGDITAWVEYQNLDKKNNVIGKVAYSELRMLNVWKVDS